MYIEARQQIRGAINFVIIIIYNIFAPMIEKYKHIIWDWNGTILNDVDLSVSLINELLTDYGLKTISLSEYKNFFTIPVRDYYESLGFDFSKDSFEVIGKKWMDEYEKRKFECRLYDGIHEVFSTISELKIGQSILSAYSQNTLEEMVKYFGLQDYFTYVIGLDNIYAASKIQQGRDLISRLGYKKGEVLFIGDTLHDLEVAKEIKADCVLLTSGHQSEEKLKSYCAQTEGVKIIPSVNKLFSRIIIPD
jgi:phosphoglycolate phosphatase